MQNSHPVYRIKADWDRSPSALASHQGLPIIDVAPIKIESSDQSSRERAAVEVHLKVMNLFLSSNAPFCVVLEDDAILSGKKDWLGFTDFDFFIPFSHNRVHVEPDYTIRVGKLPKYGAFAYLCSREFAERYVAKLLAGGLADVVSHEAARGLRFGSFVGNAVNHDNEAPSMISEERRLKFLDSHPDQKYKNWFQRLLRR
jgi:hypothetical protein